MFKNQPGQTLRVFLFNRLTNLPVAGDLGSITVRVSIDEAAPVAVSAVDASEQGDGYYLFKLAQEHTNGDILDFTAVSATPNVIGLIPHHNRFTRQAGEYLAVIDLLEADRYIDDSSVPWREVLIKRGTGTLATGERLLVRELFTLGGLPVNSIAKFVASAVVPA